MTKKILSIALIIALVLSFNISTQKKVEAGNNDDFFTVYNVYADITADKKIKVEYHFEHAEKRTYIKVYLNNELKYNKELYSVYNMHWGGEIVEIPDIDLDTEYTVRIVTRTNGEETEWFTKTMKGLPKPVEVKTYDMEAGDINNVDTYQKIMCYHDEIPAGALRIGQVFKMYVDGKFVNSYEDIPYTLTKYKYMTISKEKVSIGTHTVKLVSYLNGFETQGFTKKVTIKKNPEYDIYCKIAKKSKNNPYYLKLKAKKKNTAKRLVTLKWSNRAAKNSVIDLDVKKVKNSGKKSWVIGAGYSGRKKQSKTLKLKKKDQFYSFELCESVEMMSFDDYRGYSKPLLIAFLSKPKVKASGGKLDISWHKVTGATSYVIYASKHKKKGFKKVATTTKTKVSVKKFKGKIKANKKYYVKVQAVNKSKVQGMWGIETKTYKSYKSSTASN